MEIKINGKKKKINSYDNYQSILNSYALEQENSLPSFFRFEGLEASSLAPVAGDKITIEDARDVIYDLYMEDLNNLDKIQPILENYPLLTKKHIGFLWLLINYPDLETDPTPIDISILRNLDRFAFTTSQKAKETLKEFNISVEKERSALKKNLEKEKKIFTKLDTIDNDAPIISQSFQLTDISSKLVLDLPDGENLLDIFDAMTVNRDIPFIQLFYKKKRYFKVFHQIPPPDSWLAETLTERVGVIKESILFKIINAPYSKLSKPGVSFDEIYSDGSLMKSSNGIIIDVSYKVIIKAGITEEDIKNKILNSFGERISLKIISFKQTAIRGTFIVQSFGISRIILSDMIMNDDVMSYFLFMDEKKKTNPTKKVYRAYFQQGHTANIPSALMLTFTTAHDPKNMEIRISHAATLVQAESVRVILTKLLGYYKNNYDKIAKIYTDYVPGFAAQDSKYKKKEKIKIDKKTGKRALALRAINESLFRTRYPDQCQRHRQPYVVKTKEEAEKLAKKLGNPNKVMFYDGHWYACEPREPDDKPGKVYLFPGLQKNTSKKYPDFAKEEPILPCCYLDDQYDKKSSLLKRYLERIKTNEPQIESEEDREVNVTHILGANKKLPPWRYGDLPFLWTKILTFLGIEKISKGKKTFYPILRFGVFSSPDSFIHCLERAFNEEYIDASLQQRKLLASKVKNKLLENNRFAYSKQELYSLSYKTAMEYLSDSNYYIDPDLWVEAASIYYDCNIFLYKIDSQTPNGEIVIPKYSQAYLFRDLDPKKKSVFIFKYEAEGSDYPYQCDIAGLASVTEGGKIKNLDLIFNEHPIVEQAIKLLYEANEVFVISPEGYEPYTPVQN